MSFVIQPARIEDTAQLLALYALIYGPNYPLAFGNDRKTMIKTIQSPDFFLWLVAKDTDTAKIVGSVVFDIDPIGKIGRIVGLVVDPEVRKQRLASRLISEGTLILLGPQGPVNSLYTTTRTNSVAVQLIFLKDGFLPLGIFPNAHKLREFESLTLFAKHRPGVLEKRVPVGTVPNELGGLIAILEADHGIVTQADVAPEVAPPAPPAPGEPLEFEFIFAPEYVRREFNEKMSDPYDRFYPFHIPNFLMSSKNGETDIYAYFNKQDHYCAIVAFTTPLFKLTGRLDALFGELADMGVSYIEILGGLQSQASLQAAIDMGFVPSAIYPAMRETNNQMHDFVVLSRSMEPLNFKGMSIAKAFKPYVDQYVKLWAARNLLSLEVYDG